MVMENQSTGVCTVDLHRYHFPFDKQYRRQWHDTHRRFRSARRASLRKTALILVALHLAAQTNQVMFRPLNYMGVSKRCIQGCRQQVSSPFALTNPMFIY